ncbi:MAG TPA: HAD-IIIA family hydrolase [Candidatus Kapabacteria bacterium]|nr:HAD-IIIA family hydrolase [Candidatus Kapabacteria bacterium]
MFEQVIIEKLKKIKILAMDVDGTMTDGAMYYSRDGESLKRFSTRDGMGITLIHKAGIKSIMITSENSEIAKSRATKLNIEFVYLGTKDKSSDIINFCKKNNYTLDEICYIGDDINDELVMKLCGFSACPSDSVDIILQTADYICKNKGGNGAIRELCEMILLSQDKAISLKENW